MSSSSRSGLLGVTAAVAGAAVGVAAGVLADRAGQKRTARVALEALQTDACDLTVVPTHEVVVLATDGVPLHVEIDEPDPRVAAEKVASLAGGRKGRKSGRTSGLPTVVLSHGYCLSSRCWVYQRRALVEAGYRVVSWDQRGHGGSGKGDPDSNRMPQLGSDLHQVIDQVVPEGDLVLVGHSMGGMTILSCAQIDPDLITERVVAAAFVATSAGGIELANGGPMAQFGQVLLQRFGPGILGPLSRRPSLFQRLRRIAHDLESYLVEENSFASPVPKPVLDLTVDILMSTPLDVIRDYLEAFDNYDKRAALASFENCATLVINGVHDILTPPEHSDLIVEGVPSAEHVVVENAGHIIMLEHPELLNENLLAVIESGILDRAAAGRRSVPRYVTDVANARSARRLEKQAARLAREAGGPRQGRKASAKAALGTTPPPGPTPDRGSTAKGAARGA